MTETTCRRELELEIPVEDVKKAVERVAREFARVARVPGFARQGAGPADPPPVCRRHQERSAAVAGSRTDREGREGPEPDAGHAAASRAGGLCGGPAAEIPRRVRGAAGVRARAVQGPRGGGRCSRRDRCGRREAVDGRAGARGDVCAARRAAQRPTAITCRSSLWARRSAAANRSRPTAFSATSARTKPSKLSPRICCGAQAGEHRRFEVNYPAEYPDPKLAGKHYNYAVEVLAIKEKKLPELNDEFATSISDSKTIEELRTKMREGLEAERDQRQRAAVRDALAGQTHRRARLSGSRSDGRKSNGHAPGARGAHAGGAGSGPARGERGLGSHAPAATRPRHRGRQGGIAARPHRHGGKYRTDAKKRSKRRSRTSPNTAANPRRRSAPA